MISTALLLPSAANDLRAKSARNRTARDVFPDRFSSASDRADKEQGSSMVIVNSAKLSSPNFGIQNENVKIVNLRLFNRERNFSHIYRTRELSFTLITQRGLYDQ